MPYVNTGQAMTSFVTMQRNCFFQTPKRFVFRNFFKGFLFSLSRIFPSIYHHYFLNTLVRSQPILNIQNICHATEIK